MRTRPQARRARGFSLLEILLVAAIVGILIGLSIPFLRPRMETWSLEAAARTARQYLRYAQVLALSQNEPYQVTIHTRQNSYQIEMAGEEKEAPDDGGDLAGFPQVQLEGILLSSKSDAIFYFPDGATSGGELIFKRGGQAAHVLVKPGLGQVEIFFEKT